MTDSDSSVPYGYCHCGCGGKTSLAAQTVRKLGHVKGEPMRFLPTHHNRLRRQANLAAIADGTKDCSKCGRTWPATEEYFGVVRRVASGLKAQCRQCVREYDSQRSYAEYHARMKALNAGRGFPGEPKSCTACGGSFPGTPEFFSRHNVSPDGLNTQCKVCTRAKDRRWYYANQERVLEAQRIASKRWRRTPSGVLSRRVENQRRRSSVRSAGGSFCVDEIARMYEDQGGLCAYCATPLFGTWHVDHMTPISRGGRNDWTNLAIACPSCNLTKFTMTAEEFIEKRRNHERGSGR